MRCVRKPKPGLLSNVLGLDHLMQGWRPRVCCSVHNIHTTWPADSHPSHIKNSVLRISTPASQLIHSSKNVVISIWYSQQWRQDQEAAFHWWIAVAGAARIPARVMQLIANVGHREPVDHLGVCRRVGIQIHRRKVIWLVNACACTIIHTRKHKNPVTLQDSQLSSLSRGFCGLKKFPRQKPCELLPVTETNRQS